VIDLARSWGYAHWAAKDLQFAVCTMLLANKSPLLEELTLDGLEAERKMTPVYNRRAAIGVLSRVLVGLKIISSPLPKYRVCSFMGDARNGISPEWLRWVERWRSTSTQQANSSKRQYFCLLKLGRWATVVRPACTSPERWTREIAAEWVAAACRLKVGDWTQIEEKRLKRCGQPLSPRAKAHHLTSAATFFRDLQEWGWIPRRFDPRRCFAAPRSLRALIGPKPRIIADDIFGLDGIYEKMARGITIAAYAGSLKSDAADRLFELLDKHRGNAEVILKVELEDKTVVTIEPNSHVAVKLSSELSKAIKNLDPDFNVELILPKTATFKRAKATTGGEERSGGRVSRVHADDTRTWWEAN